MAPQLPSILQNYVTASNAHNVASILACFAETATVQNENETLSGKKAIEGWIAKTIEKYKFQYKPLHITHDPPKTILTMEVSGTFDGSPIELDFHFTIENDRIAALAIG